MRNKIERDERSLLGTAVIEESLIGGTVELLRSHAFRVQTRGAHALENAVAEVLVELQARHRIPTSAGITRSRVTSAAYASAA